MATQTGSFDFKAAKLAKDSAEATASADATAKANQAEANAKKVATNFLSQDSSGVMVYDGTSGTQTPSSPSAGTKNVLIDSNGMYVRNGSTNLASFTGSSAQIGQDSAAHSVVDANGMRVYASDGSTQIANLGYAEGTAESGTAVAPYYTLGSRASGSTIGNWSVAEGVNTTASGYMSHAEGVHTTASASGAHAEGGNGAGSPYGPTASGEGSHAEGNQTYATAHSAHSEGILSEANGAASHAQNRWTIANGESQTTLGKYNVADTTSAVIIGNGTDHGARSNALTVDWNGNVNIASGAKYKINGTNLSASDVGALPLSGGTMTGQILTSFKNSVAMGSYGAAATTVDGLVTELRYSSGCMGSANIGTAYTKDGITIGTGWYNFIYSPHRSGGANGAASGDNCNYGNLVLMGMTVSGSYLIRVSSATISEVRGLANYGDTAWQSLATDFNYIKRSGMVTVDFYKTSQSLSTSWTTIGTLPSGYRPNHNLYGAAMSLTTTPIAYFINSSSGVVQMRTATGSGSYVTAFSVSYPVL